MVRQHDIQIDTDDVEMMMTRVTLWMDDSNLSDFTRDTFGDIMQDAVAVRFATESNNSQAWPALKTITEKRRMEQGFPGPHPINVRTGEMRRFLVHSVPEPGSGGSDIEYSWPERATGELFMKMLRAQGWDQRVQARIVIDAGEAEMDKFIAAGFDSLERAMR